jgi:hypothetical protein
VLTTQANAFLKLFIVAVSPLHSHRFRGVALGIQMR